MGDHNFETAQLVFDDPLRVTFVDRVTHGEEHWQAIGAIENVIILVVVNTDQVRGSDEVVRILSARPATRRERRLYVQTIG